MILFDVRHTRLRGANLFGIFYDDDDDPEFRRPSALVKHNSIFTPPPPPPPPSLFFYRPTATPTKKYSRFNARITSPRTRRSFFRVPNVCFGLGLDAVFGFDVDFGTLSSSDGPIKLNKYQSSAVLCQHKSRIFPSTSEHTERKYGNGYPTRSDVRIFSRRPDHIFSKY